MNYKSNLSTEAMSELVKRLHQCLTTKEFVDTVQDAEFDLHEFFEQERIPRPDRYSGQDETLTGRQVAKYMNMALVVGDDELTKWWADIYDRIQLQCLKASIQRVIEATKESEHANDISMESLEAREKDIQAMRPEDFCIAGLFVLPRRSSNSDSDSDSDSDSGSGSNNDVGSTQGEKKTYTGVLHEAADRDIVLKFIYEHIFCTTQWAFIRPSFRLRRKRINLALSDAVMNIHIQQT